MGVSVEKFQVSHHFVFKFLTLKLQIFKILSKVKRNEVSTINLFVGCVVQQPNTVTLEKV